MPQESKYDDLQLAITTAYLKQAQYLQQMDVAQLEHLATCATHRHFEADESLIEQGTDIDSLLVILQGEVSVSLEVGAVRTVWLYTAGPGIAVDPAVLMDSPASPISVYALSSVDALEIPRDCLLSEIEKQPAIGYAMMRQLCERLSLIARVVAKQSSIETVQFSVN